MSSGSFRCLHPSLLECVKLDVLVPFLNKEQLPTENELFYLNNPLIAPGIRINTLIDCIESHHEEGLGKFYRCLRCSAYKHAPHARLANEMLQHWPQLSPAYEPAPSVAARPTFPCQPSVLDSVEVGAGQVEFQQCNIVAEHESSSTVHYESPSISPQPVSFTEYGATSSTAGQDISSTVHKFLSSGGESKAGVTIGKVH